ncbi:HSP20 family protein [Pullulanibacillus pueri]|uniref:SHSP domain-containing protein n=1 Tax=Pullulanibacillus pueri TaxID=1437324 RepID=A0A8J2ZWA2_9BACL|nr:Hsp20/alpha crystallin family protein [Pullulanibacillus pueri]MBM7682767.1 HSP20 family protein [Pullulanibacillus pueri]GGH83110.1 hypothetical protein GCM10007096_23490 [Pullulanibacillus pueri]
MEEKSKYKDWKKSVNQFLGQDFWNEFQNIFAKEWPRVNLYESDQSVLCLIALPGVQKLDHIHIYINHSTILIKGHNTYSFPGFKTVNEELPKGEFERMIDLPAPVHNKPIEATFSRGMMKITLRKIDAHEVSEIIVQENDED